MKRYDRMIEMQGQIVSIISSLEPTRFYVGEQRMKTLTLSLTRKWFDLIKVGIKKEEYRECSEYWIKRLDDEKNHCFKHFDKIVFTLGYPKKDDMSRRLEFKNPSIHYRTGKPEWGAEPNKLYFVITWEE